MQLLYDFLPLLAFFIAYKLTNIFFATGVLVVAALVMTAFQWIRHRKVSPIMLVSTAVALIFGSLTLLLHDDMFIKWKVTAVYWVLAAAFLLTHVLGKRPLMQQGLADTIPLPDAAWAQLNLAYVIFFALEGALNLYVIYHFDTDTWIKFKVFGLTGLMVLFAIGQTFWLASKLPDEEPAGKADEKLKEPGL